MIRRPATVLVDRAASPIRSVAPYALLSIALVAVAATVDWRAALVVGLNASGWFALLLSARSREKALTAWLLALLPAEAVPDGVERIELPREAPPAGLAARPSAGIHAESGRWSR